MSTTPKTPLGRSYWKLWSATTTSNVGDGVRFAALPLLATTLTRDPVLVAGTVVASQLPWLLFALVSGALVDRLDRRVLMLAANLFRAFAMALLGLAVLSGIESLGLVYVVVFLLGSAETLFDSASFALLPALVDESDLERANGPIAGNGYLQPGVRRAAARSAAVRHRRDRAFFVDAASFALAAGIAFTIKGGGRPEREEGALVAGPKEEVVEGLRWVRGQSLLRSIMVIAAVMNIVFFATFSIRVLFATEILGLDATGFGLLMVADGGGGLLGALTAARVSAQDRPWSGVGGSRRVTGRLHVRLGVTSEPWIAWLALAVGGIGGFLWNVVAISVAQSLTPDRQLASCGNAPSPCSGPIFEVS